MGVDPDTGSVIMGGSIHLPRIDNIKRTIEYLRKYSINVSIEETSLLFDEVDDQVDFSAYIETYSGVKELLENLKKTDIKVVIFTHDSTSAAEKHLKNAGIKSYFDLILGIDPDSTYHKKPAPDMIQYACKILEANVNAAVVIGDQETDMLAGKNAGALGCIGVLTGKSEEKDLTHADIIIQSVGEIKVK
ncbi:MAG: HAD family hydrolase [Candidatus Heimdallarchaeota archaeon]|nr:HAD family hydrolase [Candidatus Heimdallarchaeota archaeon]